MSELESLAAPLPVAKRDPERQLRLRCIGCEVLARPIYLAAAQSPHVVDVTFLRRGLHDTPATLRERLQAEIDAAAEADPPYDTVVLAYGLCGGATAGVGATGIPLVVPRAHDCITLFLGSRDRYQREFTAHPGTYWYATDYVERSDPGPGGATTGLLGIGANSDAQLQAAYADYVERFGRDNADYLMAVMGAWREHYDRAVFIDMGVSDASAVEAQAREEAERRGWLFERMAGELMLIRGLLEADWGDDFLIVLPGHRLAMTYDEGVVRAVEP